MGIFSSLFGSKNKKIQEFISRGAIILDVRTRTEYESGAIPGSHNIPLQQLSTRLKDIEKFKKPIIACCASGVRSGTAARILKGNGIEAVNGGGWSKLSKKL